MIRIVRCQSVYPLLLTLCILNMGGAYGQLISSKTNQRKIEKKWQKQSKSIVPENFVLFSGGTITVGDNFDYKVPENDSNTLENVFSDPRRISLSPFAISKNEVTNYQYKSFLRWVIDSIAMTIMAQTDPSYYLDSATKKLDWRKRKNITDTSLFSKLYPLYDFISDTTQKYGIKYRVNTQQVRYTFRLGSKLGQGSILVYPDTACWHRENMYPYDYIHKYFSRDVFDNYPVVGVSWHQAQAFCDWLSRQGAFEFRLPNSVEFQSAYLYPFNIPFRVTKSAKRGEELINTQFTGYPWNRYELFDHNGAYMANFGSISDDYGYLVKGSNMDGGFYTTRTGAYPPSISGLYDLAGNVAEWVSDTITSQYSLLQGRFSWRSKDRVDSVKADYIYLEGADEFATIVNKVMKYYSQGPSGPAVYEYWQKIGSPIFLPKEDNQMDSSFYIRDGGDIIMYSKGVNPKPWYHDEIRSLIQHATLYYRNLQVIRSIQTPRAVMGGSWKDGPLMMRFGVKRVYDANTSASSIGFRVATDAKLTPELQSMLKTNKSSFSISRKKATKKT